MLINCIIQARSTSSRFPNKVLKKIGNLNLLEIIKLRLNKSKFIDKIIFAIPKNKKNINLKIFLEKKEFDFFQGSENNVLKRIWECSRRYNSKVIVRITADCPLIDYNLVDLCIKQFIESKKSYLSSRYNTDLPDGLDVEVFDFQTLNKVFVNAKKRYDFEHVTSYIINHNKFKKKKLIMKYKNNYNKKLSIDTNSDFKRVKKIFNYFGNYNFSNRQLLNYLGKI